MSKIRGHGNATTEKTFRYLMVREGVSGWNLNPKGVLGAPDVYFPAQKLAVFLDGCFWHGCPKCGHVPKNNRPYWKAKINRNRERDRSINRRLRKQSIRVIRFWEHEIQADPKRCISKLKRAQKYG